MIILQEITGISVGSRLKDVIDHYKVSTLEFSRAIGFDRADKIYNILHHKFNPSFEILLAITNYYVNINIHWLVTGKGNMLLDRPSVLTTAEKDNTAAGHIDPGGCERCKMKDEINDGLKQQVLILNKLLKKYEDQDSPKVAGQKRKAAS